jgi:hypothetical protein
VTEPAVDPVAQTGAPDDAPPPSRDDVAALTKAKIEEAYGVPQNQSHDAMVDAVMESFGVPKPKASEVTLAVSFPVDRHHYEAGEPPITTTGTVVPASKADDIIATAAAQGVTIRKVN